MNDKAKKLRECLKLRRINIEALARAAGVEYKHLCLVLSGARPGRQTWKRILVATTPREQRLIVDTYGPVFGKDWVDETLLA